MRLRTHVAAVILMVAAFAISHANAQAAVLLQPGEPVRVRIVGPPPLPADTRCAGFVHSVVRDTLLLRGPGDCPAGNYLVDLRVVRGDRGSRLEHTGLGFLAGAVTGGVLAKLSVGDGCRIHPCDEGAFAAGIVTMFGTAVGALTGTLVGALLPAGPQWVDAGRARPLRR